MMMMRFAALLAALLLVAPARAATWDVRVQEKAPVAGQCVTGLSAGVLQTSACLASLSLSTSAANLFALSGSGGALTFDLVSVAQNTVLAGPASGGAGKPVARALACADLPAGARCLLATLTASNSASLSDTTSLLSGYTEYEIVIENLLPDTNAVDLYLQVQIGASLQTSGYNFVGNYVDTAGTSSYGTMNAAALNLSRPGLYTANAAPGHNGALRLSNPAQTSGPKAMVWNTVQPATTGDLNRVSGGGWQSGSGAITGLQFRESSGNMTSGVIKIYGWN